MCGIVGLFIKDRSLDGELGHLLSGMLTTMCDRGPDSAGFAVYGEGVQDRAKVTVQSADPDAAFDGLAWSLRGVAGGEVGHTRQSTLGVLDVPAGAADAVRGALKEHHPGVRVMATGEAIEIYKEA